MESEWLKEDIRDSSTPLQLDVFHLLWETYQNRDCRPRLEPAPSKGGRDNELRTRALQDAPVDTQVGRPPEGADGVSRLVVGQVYDVQVPYWRVRYPDGDGETLGRREMDNGVLKRQDTQGREIPPLSEASTRQRRKAGGVGITPRASGTPVLSRS